MAGVSNEFCSLITAANMLNKTTVEIRSFINSGQLTNYGTDIDPRLKTDDVKKLAQKPIVETGELQIVEEPPIEKETGGLVDLSTEPGATAFGDKVFQEVVFPETTPAETPTEEGPPVPGRESVTTGIETEVAEPEVPAVVFPQKFGEETHPISNWIMMFTALVAVIFGLIIAIAGSRGFTPSLLSLIKDIFWWLLLGAIVLVLASWAFPQWIFPQIVAHMRAVVKTKKKKISPEVKPTNVVS